MPNIEIPDFKINKAFRFLFAPARYKICYGGRGAGRSWNYARYMLYRAMIKKEFILCMREIQKSILESVHRTLANQIAMLDLSKYFDVNDRSIKCVYNHSEFVFEGLFRNVNKIKSIDGITIADIEEAENVSEESWKTLIPTVREKGSEILVRFNTKYTDDPTYQRFITQSRPDAIVKMINWDQNPHFPEVLRVEKDQDYALRPHEARNIWGGEPIGYGRKVWQDFDEKIHVRDFDMQLVADKGNCFMAMDPAQHYYPACLFMAIIPKNQRLRYPEDFYKYIYAEWPTVSTLDAPFHEARKKLLFTGTLSDLSKSIYIAEGAASHGIKVLKRGIDTRFAKGSGSGNYFSGESLGLVSEFAKRENGGLVFSMPFEKIIDVQKNNILTDMRYNTLIPLNSLNEPTLFISPSCKNLITSLNNHRLDEDSEKESEKYKDFSDCFTGNTPIWTVKGRKSIKKIKVGDIVLTSTGPRKVVDSFCTGYKPVYKAKFSNGAILNVTGTHNFYVNGVKKPLIKLTSSDALSILEIPKPKEKLCQLMGNQFTFSLMEKSIIGTQSLKVVLIASITIEAALSRCIKMFGSCIMVQYQKVWQFITKTTMPRITLLKILRWCHVGRMSENICLSPKGQVPQKDLSNCKTYDLYQKSGMQVKRESSGIENIGRSALKRCLRKLTKYASTVETHIKGRSAPSSAVKNVSTPITTLASLKEYRIKRKTYNITVEGKHEYYANGILVANCMRILYATISDFRYDDPAKQAHEQQQYVDSSVYAQYSNSSDAQHSWMG